MAVIVIPFVNAKLNQKTVRAAYRSGFRVHFWSLDAADHGAYGRMFRGMWAKGETFVICEHDVVPTPAQFSAIVTCGHPWCSYEYDDGLYPGGPMFGLVRFDERVMRCHPLAASVALITGKRKDDEAPWWQVDSLMARDLMIRGVPWSKHFPPVHHEHHGPPSGP